MISLRLLYEQTLDIKQIHDVVRWHQENRDHKPGESVGIFAVMPQALAKQFPTEGREGHDSSPSHITVLYMGNVPEPMMQPAVDHIERVCMETKPFMATIKKPKTFVNDKGEIILHCPIKSRKLEAFHEKLKSELQRNLISVDNKFPEFKPHITIAYCKDKEELKKYEGFEIYPPDFVIDSIYVWGGKEPKYIYLGK